MTSRYFLPSLIGAVSLLAVASAQAEPIVPAPREAVPVISPRMSEVADTIIASRPAEKMVDTLREAIALAYAGNPTLESQRASLRATDNRYPAARGRFGPTLDVTASYGYQYDRTEILAGTFSGLDGFSSTASAILSQPLFTFGRNAANSKLALAQIAFGRDSLRLTEAQTLLGAVSAYVAVRRDLMAVKNAQENLGLLDRQLADSRERFRVREITSTDLQQIETRVELGRAQLFTAQGQYGASESQFLQTVGARPGDLAAPDLLVIPATTLDQAYEYADKNSAIIRAAQSREKISRAAIEAAKAEFGPRVDLRGRGTYGTVTPYSDDFRTTTVRGEVVLTVPLIDGGVRRAQLREAEEANSADWRLVEQSLRDTRQGVASGWNRVAAARSAVGNYRLAVAAARKAYEGALIQEKAGARTTLDVLDLARDLLFMQNGLNGAIADEQLARASLLAAMGLMEGPLLLPELRAYDPEVHFDKVRNKGGIPLLSPALESVDSLTVRDVDRDRAITDPAATVKTDAIVAMPPETTP